MYSLAKAVISGSIAEFYLYRLPIAYGYEKPKIQRNLPYEKSEQEKQDSKKRSLLQTKRALRNILQSNAWQHFDNKGKPYLPLFITFTFKENVKELTQAHRQFKLFIQRFNFRFYGRSTAIRYLAVPEFQKRGAVHYHVIFFNLPFIKNIYDQINNLWGNGFTLVESIKNLSHMVNYVAKYLTADGLDERLIGRKRYFASRGLVKPLEIRDEEIISNLLKQLPKETIKYQKYYSSDDGQETEYINYDIGQGLQLAKQLNNLLVGNCPSYGKRSVV